MINVTLVEGQDKTRSFPKLMTQRNGSVILVLKEPDFKGYAPAFDLEQKKFILRQNVLCYDPGIPMTDYNQPVTIQNV